MNVDELKKSFTEATAEPPPGARARTWRALSEHPTPAPSRRPALLAMAAALSLSLAGAWWYASSQPTSGQRSDETTAVVWRDARVTHADGALTVTHGTVAISSWGAPVKVHAGAHRLEVENAVVVLRVAGESISMNVVTGSVLFDGTSMEASVRRADDEPVIEDVLRLEAPAAHLLRVSAQAEHAVARGDFQSAATAFAEVASTDSLGAEVANFRQGELELRELGQPALALKTFAQGERRFPGGALTQERQLSAIESCVHLERWDEVEQRVRAFLTRFPSTERAVELTTVLARARLARGDRAGACELVGALPPAAAEPFGDACR